MKTRQAFKKHVTLTLTEACNLDCIYCYEDYKSKNVMSFDNAKSIIKQELLAEDGFTDVAIEFFGGEPFLEFDTIKKIYSYVWDNRWVKNRLCSATTNGTLVCGEIKEWLEKHRKRFWCCLSLDGTKEMHDENRCNSFDDIDFEFFKKMWPEQGIKMTISNHTLSSLSKGVQYAHYLGFDVSCNLAYGTDWNDNETYSLLENQLYDLIDFYLNNPDIKPCSMLSMAIEQVAIDKEKTRKWCGAGTQMHTYDVYGKLYPCQFFMPLSVGKEKAEQARKIVFNEEIPIEKLDNKCQSCRAKNICSTCYGSNYMQYGNIYKKNDVECKLTKLMLLACSYFMYMRWEAKQIELSDSEEYRLLKAIEIIQTNF